MNRTAGTTRGLQRGHLDQGKLQMHDCGSVLFEILCKLQQLLLFVLDTRLFLVHFLILLTDRPNENTEMGDFD